MSGTSPAVFISYASEDAEAAARISEALRAASIEVWFDRSELRGGDAWDRQIRERIHNCRLFIAVISATTEARDEGYFRREWKLAVDRTEDLAEDIPFLLPVVIDATPESTARVPRKFREVHWTRLPGGTTTQEFVTRVMRLLSRDPVPASARPTHVADIRHRTKSTRIHEQSTKRRALILVAVAVSGVAAAWLLVDRFWLATHAPLEKRVATPAAAPAVPATPEKSVAVLPFVDMSERKDQEYFSDGLSEELIEMLSKIPDLRVPARTSSFYFKGKPTTVGEIARVLGVAHVLEGSVRKSGRHLRITAQLIRADNGYHLWSETYNRTLDDIFKVQDDIAGEVVKALKISLGENEVPRAVATKSADAHSLLLQAEYFLNRTTPEDITRAVDYFQQTIRLDPDSAPAWAGLSIALTVTWQNGWLPRNRTFEQQRTEALQAAERAIEIDPKFGLAHEALASIRYWFDWDWAGVEAEIAKGRAFDPASTWTAGSLASLRGDLNDALRHWGQVTERDPLNSDARLYLAEIYYARGQYTEALAAARKAVDFSPTASRTHAALAQMLLAVGQPDAALAAVDQETDVGYRAHARARTYFLVGRRPEADAALAEFEKSFAADWAYEIAAVHALRGETDQAFLWLDRAYQQRNGGLIGTPSIKIDRDLMSLRGDPRYKAFIRKMKLPE